MIRRTVVIAPDSFTGSIDARSAAAAIAAGWRDIRPLDDVIEIPQADGGEGTLDAILASVPSARAHVVDDITGPDGRRVSARWLELPRDAAAVELASSSGRPLMIVPDPLGATTFGLGEVICAALDAGARRLIVGLGGSASTDGGTGALAALGLRLRDSSGADLERGGGALARLASVDPSGLRVPPADGTTVLTDVSAPLTGTHGAARVFGPQKGASPRQIELLDRGLARFATSVGGDPDAPGAGAAGGTAFGLAACWGARIEPGAAFIARLTGLLDAIESADILVTGEGRFDRTSLTGKVTGHALGLARARGIDTVVIAGSIDDRVREIDSVDPLSATAFESLGNIAGSIANAMAQPAVALHEAGRRAARRSS